MGLSLDDGNEVVTAGNNGGFDGDGAGVGDDWIFRGRRRRGRDCVRRWIFRSKTTKVVTIGLPLDDDNNVVTAGDDGGFDGDSASGGGNRLVLGRQ